MRKGRNFHYYWSKFFFFFYTDHEMYTCDFEEGMCEFTQTLGDDFDWTRNQSSFMTTSEDLLAHKAGSGKCSSCGDCVFYLSPVIYELIMFNLFLYNMLILDYSGPISWQNFTQPVIAWPLTCRVRKEEKKKQSVSGSKGPNRCTCIMAPQTVNIAKERYIHDILMSTVATVLKPHAQFKENCTSFFLYLLLYRSKDI